MKKKFAVEGMTCAACQAHVQKAVEKVDGVKSVNVNLLKNDMVVEYDASLSPSVICAAVEKAGYRAYPDGENATPAQKGKDYALAKLIASAVLLLILMYFSMGNMMWGFPAPSFLDHAQNPVGFALIQLVLVTPILVIYRGYFVSGFKKLFKGKPNMDSLIAVGATASVLYGVFALFALSYAQARIASGVDVQKWTHTLHAYHDSLYFESAGMILTLVSLGKYLEGLSKKRTTAAITKLMDLAPKRATVLVDGTETVIPAEDVRAGDILVVRAGESVPVDGEIIEGNGSLDQSNITGESIPVFKGEGDEVFSSTTVTAGYFKMRAVKVGEDTSIANIIRLVDEASNSKAPISKLADKISGVFVPIIFAIALVTLAANLIAGATFERALNFAITVVVIACPCALGLATPVAIMVGTGKGAANGLLIKNAEILEKAHLIKTVVLDKTGTLTEGKPKVVDFESYVPDMLDVVYSVEQRSEHPLALAVIEYARAQNAHLYEISDYAALPGKGLTATVNGTQYFIGNVASAEQAGVPAEELAKAREWATQGKTPLILEAGGHVLAALSVKDEVKPTSAEAVRLLTARGIKVVMLTGDNRATAEVIAKEVGIGEVISDVRPEDKQNVVNSFKSDGKHLVAMVGDGVNDAPALASADLGIAIGGGSDIAAESADIVLLRNDLLDVLNVIALSRRTLNTIKLGLFWAFFYNCVCVLFATGAFSYIDSNLTINPMIGSLAMSISSVSVVLNALTINFFKMKGAPQKEQASSGAQDDNRDMPKKHCANCGTEDSRIPKTDEGSRAALAEGDSSQIQNQFDEATASNQNMTEANMATKSIVFNIEGMMCDHCVKHVTKACMSVSGVRSAEVSLQAGTATLQIDEGTDVKAIELAIEDAGYEVKK